ncbi:MAG: discoidin domain-containing protein [Limisphaerales bacterium]
MRTFSACLLLLSALVGLANTSPQRDVISLNGEWQVAEGALDKPPTIFEHRVPVPGLLDLAKPKIVEVGTTNSSSLREAFWYRRTFHVKQSIPAIAFLKVHKANYGARVYLNGKLLGEHLPSFTPGFFDAHTVLRRGENEIIIRVGATRQALPHSVPDGFDFEKVRYIPGLFDSVELTLSGTPNIVRVQVAPDITNHIARVQTCISNAGPAGSTKLHFRIREARSHHIVAEASSADVELAANTQQTINTEIPIPNCKLWSPEEPFLYQLETSTDADTATTRFGMREFRLDHVTGHAFLNGRRYFLRGSNITLYRFFEDAVCRDLPWRDDWVRRLHRAVKSMHWTSLRYCIGFPPERWYDIADEEGILIEDEFPIWFGIKNWPTKLKSDELVREYTEWMQERWNHPCVVIWDAQNETITTETGKAIHQVRNLDLSHRPWDNGYGAADDPNDECEVHPYLNNKPHFTFEDLAVVAPKPEIGLHNNSTKNPTIINEYAWLWLNRDGAPTTLTKAAYANLLGTNATPALRFHLYARYLSAKTEFWRSHRQVAGVLHFCALGYSRTNGQTCDNFADVEKLKFEPEFQNYVRDAFAPVGLMIDDFSEELIASSTHHFRVAVINDLYDEWTGTVRFRVLNGKRVIHEQSAPCTVAALGRTELAFTNTLPGTTGTYTFEAALIRGHDKPVRSVREIAIVTASHKPPPGLAKLKPVTASSYLQTLQPEKAVDASKFTRWCSEFSDLQWLAVDLGEVKTISSVKLMWERAYAKSYSIQISDDAQNWRSVFHTDNGSGGDEDIHFQPVQTQWVRFYGTKRGTEFGYSLWEFEVFP